MIRRPPRSTPLYSSAASDVYKRQVETQEKEEKKKKATQIAKGAEAKGSYEFDILGVIAARNEKEAKTGLLIQDFESKIKDFFEYVRNTSEGNRLIVKINSHS